MKLFLIKHENEWPYDVYTAAVVAAETAEEAQLVHPGNSKEPYAVTWDEKTKNWLKPAGDDCWRALSVWTDPCNVEVLEIGKCTDKNVKSGEVICAAFAAN